MINLPRRLPTLSRRSWFLLILGAGVLLRLTLAYLILPKQGFASDMSQFADWAAALAKGGPGSERCQSRHSAFVLGRGGSWKDVEAG